MKINQSLTRPIAAIAALVIVASFCVSSVRSGHAEATTAAGLLEAARAVIARANAGRGIDTRGSLRDELFAPPQPASTATTSPIPRPLTPRRIDFLRRRSARPDQSRNMDSPLDRVPTACQTAKSIESRTDRTLPSPMQTLTTPEW